jgi:hypothetical protein
MVRFRIITALCALLPITAACTSSISGTPHVAAAKGGCSSGGNVVEPEGGPYCYSVPKGFASAQAQLGGAKYTPAVALDKQNLIIAGVFPAPTDLDKLSDSELTTAVNQLLDQQDSAGFKLASPDGKLTKQPAGRALEYHAVTNSTPPINVDLYIVSRGHTKVQLNCQSTNQEKKIETGCQQVLHSLRITSGS